MKRIILVIICSLVIANYLFATTPDSKCTEYVSFLHSQSLSPCDYLTQKVRQYNVVSLGEDHWVRDHMDILCDYLNVIARDTTIHLDALAWESGNYIVHEYFQIDDEVVWGVVTEDLSVLRQQIIRYLEETDWGQWEKTENQQQ